MDALPVDVYLEYQQVIEDDWPYRRGEPCLFWRADMLRKVLEANGIGGRDELAMAIRETGVSRSAVYRAFDIHWRGKATTRLMAALAWTFDMSVSDLIIEPTKGSVA